MNLENEVAYRRSLFEQKVSKGAMRDCWEWIGAKTAKGAGTFGLGDLGGVRSAHVAAWLLYRDPGYDLNLPHIFYHVCGKKSCVNPRHLAIIGPDGLANPQEVARFLADSYPNVRTQLTSAAEGLPALVASRGEAPRPSADSERRMDSSALFQRVSAWYADQLDGEWEHRRGISIRTYAEPGWWVTIDLKGTEFEDKPFNSISEGSEGAATGWMYCCVNENTFEGAGDLDKLPLILEVFLGWVGQ